MRNSPLTSTSIHILGDDSLHYEGIDPGAVGGEFQRQRYAPVSCNAYQIASKHGLCTAVHLLHQSTYLTMTLFNTKKSTRVQ